MKDIIFLSPFFVEKVWGSRKLKEFNYTLPGNNPIGEAWVISGLCKHQSIIKNTKFKGMKLGDLWKNNPEIFGNKVNKINFPLLSKIIDANQSLSIQVHPNDKQAHDRGLDSGKTECWYVLAAQPGATIVYGHTAKNKEELKSLIESDNWDKLLVDVPIKPGDFYYVPAGKIHALKSGTIVFELQQSADVTYRLYDYKRMGLDGKPRQLDIEDSIDVTTTPDTPAFPNSHDEYLVDNNLFKLIKLQHKNHEVKKYKFETAPWIQATVTSGSGKIDNIKIKMGDSFILPNGYNEFTLEGKITVLLSYTDR